MKEIGQFFKDRLNQANPDIPDQLWNNIQKAPELKRLFFSSKNFSAPASAIPLVPPPESTNPISFFIF